VPAAPPELGIPATWLDDLRCPATGQALERRGDWLTTADGGVRYPVVGGVPILIADHLSLFSQADYLAGGSRHERHPGGLGEASTDVSARAALERRSGRVRGRISSALPTLSRNHGARANYGLLVERLRAMAPGRRHRVLVLGGQIPGEGFEPLLEATDVELVETYVGIGPRTRIVCDAQRLPFSDGAFDAVTVQALLDLIPEPDAVAAEVHRVLAPGGLVYSEIGFMQQYHEGDYDYVRYTPLGHRRLWRAFDTIALGAQCGPGMAVAWALRAYLIAWMRRKAGRDAMSVLARLAFWWLPLTDRALLRRTWAVEGASGTFFLGARRTEPLDDRAVLESYAQWRRDSS
jgi:SAM-dependent methyltransferase